MDSRPKRRSIRLRGYDYSRAGAYFVSICTKERTCLFGDIDNQQMALNAAGRMLDKWYVELENKFKDIRCDEYIIMPNHFHAIIQNIGPVGADLCVCPDDHRHGRTSCEAKMKCLVFGNTSGTIRPNGPQIKIILLLKIKILHLDRRYQHTFIQAILQIVTF